MAFFICLRCTQEVKPKKSEAPNQHEPEPQNAVLITQEDLATKLGMSVDDLELPQNAKTPTQYEQKRNNFYLPDNKRCGKTEKFGFGKFKVVLSDLKKLCYIVRNSYATSKQFTS